MHLRRKLSAASFLLPGLLWLASCGNGGNAQMPVQATDTAAARAAVLGDDSSLLREPYLATRQQLMEAALQQPIPVLLLQNADAQQQQAQQIAIADPRLKEALFDPASGKPLRTEVFNVYPARPGDNNAGNGNAYRVELYSYPYNLTIVVMVDLAEKKVLSLDSYPQTQPDLPAGLRDIALKIAVHSPAVVQALGYQPGQEDALMASTKTALNATRCERSQHLCVAPTFVKGDKALWAIVDLTDYKLVGIRWTNVGTTGQSTERISERKLQFEKIMECNCRQVTALERDGWKMNYVLTSSDGLRISEVFYNGQLVIHNAKLVDWHVSYSATDGFGYSDAVGCPEYSQAAVVAVSQPAVKVLKGNDGSDEGFVLEQEFRSEQWPRPCNYNYVQRYEFYKDGRLRVACASLGRGCGNDGTYRPVTRIVFAGEQNSFSEWDGNAWQPWATEGWRLQSPQSRYTGEGYQYRIGNGFYMMPGNGRFGDGGRGDNAYVYVTRYHTDRDEGEKDLVTLGPCCNTDYHQGPEKFIEPSPENIRSARLVVWYVAQLKNDDTKGHEYCWAESVIEKGIYQTKAYPCMSGPMFIPVQHQTAKR